MSAAPLQLAAVTLGALGFSLIFNVRGRQLLFTTLGGALAWTVCLLLRPTGWSDPARYFAASVVITGYAELSARRRRAPATVFLTAAAIPLLPGSRLYAAMFCAVHGDGAGFVRYGLDALRLAGAVAGGIILVSAILHAAQSLRRRGPGPDRGKSALFEKNIDGLRKKDL